MGFERFEGKRPTGDRKPMVALTADGAIVLNAIASRECVGAARFVDLYFDPVRRGIGLRFLPEASGSATYRITVYNKQGKSRSGFSSSIACRKFFDTYRIPKKHLRRPLAWNAREELWTFKVNAIA